MTRLVQVIVVLLALALGQVVTDVIDVGGDERGAAPFVRSGAIGDRVELEYADVQLSELRTAAFLAPDLSTSGATTAAGIYVVAMVTLTATQEPTSWLGVRLLDRQGRYFLSSAKSTCDRSPRTETRVPSYAMFCFDVPTDALQGLRLEVARGDYLIDEQRRDDLARIDLGIDAGEAEELGASEAVYRVQATSRQPLALIDVDLTLDAESEPTDGEDR